MFFTKIVPMNDRMKALLDMDVPDTVKDLIKARLMTEEEYVEKHLSGTLRKNMKLGFRTKNQYIHERVCHDFGWSFECVPASRVMLGAPFSEGDCKPVTEAGWFIERHNAKKFFDDDVFTAAYINVDDGDGKRREGIGIFVEQTNAVYVGKGMVVFAIIAEFDVEADDFKEAENPC